MSSDNDDLGGFAPTTPAAPARAKRNARSVKPNSQQSQYQPDAGPSTQPARVGKKGSSTQPIYIDPEQEKDELASIQTDSTTQRKASVPARSNASQSQQIVNGSKRKQRAGSKARTTKKPPESEVQVIEDSDDVVGEVGKIQMVIDPPPQPGPSRARQKESAKDSAIIRERKRADDAEAWCHQLTRQLDELNNLRETEPERLVELLEEQHRAEIDVKDKLINELNAALAKVEPLARDGKTSVLHLLTREAADQEKKTLQHELARLKEQVAQRDQVIKQKDEIIQDLKETERLLQGEIGLLRENSQKIKPPGSVQRSRGTALGSDDPKHAEVIRFYEDTTNILLTNVKSTPGNTDKDEWIMTCIYSYFGEDPDPKASAKSLNFTLRTAFEKKKPEDVVETMYYVPKQLENEPQDFVDKLSFLGSPFTFPRTQLSLFLRTMYETIGTALEEEGSDAEMDEGS